jgi:hypothetical protein
MAPPASSVIPMPEAGHREELPVSTRPPTAVPPSPTPGDHRLRPLDVDVCSLCGVARPLGLLVPDGKPESADVRWYCKDVKSCTERWTAARPLADLGGPAGPVGRPELALEDLA